MYQRNQKTHDMKKVAFKCSCWNLVEYPISGEFSWPENGAKLMVAPLVVRLGHQVTSRKKWPIPNPPAGMLLHGAYGSSHESSWLHIAPSKISTEKINEIDHENCILNSKHCNYICNDWGVRSIPLLVYLNLDLQPFHNIHIHILYNLLQSILIY